MTVAFYDTWWWALLNNTFFAAWVAFLVANTARRRAAPGTRHRYVATTIAWAAAYPALGIVFTNLIRGAATHSILSLIVGFTLLVFWLFEYLELVRSDDDNWFRRTGKRLRRWFAARLPSLSPAPSRI